jgi:hypothetical protein
LLELEHCVAALKVMSRKNNANSWDVQCRDELKYSVKKRYFSVKQETAGHAPVVFDRILHLIDRIRQVL